MPEQPNPEAIDTTIAPFRGRKGVLLTVFHHLQERFGYIPKEAMEPIADALGMHPSTVYGSLTFYTELRTAPPPRVVINMCLGPTCHLHNAETIRDILEHKLGVEGEAPSADGACGIHVVQCAGHCQHAPLLYLNNSPRLNVKVSDAAALAQEAWALAGA